MSCEDVRAEEWREQMLWLQWNISKGSEKDAFIHHMNGGWSLFHVSVMRASIFKHRASDNSPDQWNDAFKCGNEKDYSHEIGHKGIINGVKSFAILFLPCITRMQTCLMCWSLGSLPLKGKYIFILILFIELPKHLFTLWYSLIIGFS